MASDEGLLLQLVKAQAEIQRLSEVFNSTLDMLQEDDRWQERALALLEQLVHALQRTSRLLAAKELSITEADLPRQNEQLLEQARAFLTQHEE
jgi:hypothetical protein